MIPFVRQKTYEHFLIYKRERQGHSYSRLQLKMMFL